MEQTREHPAGRIVRLDLRDKLEPLSLQIDRQLLGEEFDHAGLVQLAQAAAEGEHKVVDLGIGFPDASAKPTEKPCNLKGRRRIPYGAPPGASSA